jgi:hypothetical protein
MGLPAYMRFPSSPGATMAGDPEAEPGTKEVLNMFNR